MFDIMNLLMSGETKYIEIKERFSKTILKTVSAFSNFHDGRIIIGITDDGRVIGIDKPIEVRLSIENTINDSVKPRPEPNRGARGQGAGGSAAAVGL